MVLGVTGLVLQIGWLNQAAWLLLFLNGFNLLPFLPLDGGHVLQDILFCRHRWLEVTFRVLAATALLSLGAIGFGRWFVFLGILMVLGLPLASRLARVRDSLRNLNLPPPLPGEDRIPVATAQAIITALKAALPKGVGNPALAQRTLNVFESLNARPPGVPASLGLLALHGGAFLLALVFGMVVLIGKNGGLGDFVQAAAHQPAHAFQCGHWQNWPVTADGTLPTGKRTVLVATFKKESQAAAVFAEITNQVPAGGRATWFGESVLLALPVTDAPAQTSVLNRLRTQAADFMEAPSNQPVMVNVSFIAPTAMAVTNLGATWRVILKFPATYT